MESLALNYASQAMYLVLIVSLPPIVVASLVGLLLSLGQAVTQLQEQTLTFGVKLLAVVLTIFVIGDWLMAEIVRYGGEIFNNFHLF